MNVGDAEPGASADVSSKGRPMDLEFERTRMIEHHLRGRGIRDGRILEAFRDVPREAFVPPALRSQAYDDSPLPIGDGQTISQPYIVAYTAAAMRLVGNERVLEVGTGSGYAAAILSRLAREVFTVERIGRLAHTAHERLATLGYTNIRVATADGTLGWRTEGPFDAIAVAASGPSAPPSLLDQLVVGGRLVIPIGPDPSAQWLVRFTRRDDGTFHQERLADVRYVPLIGAEGWVGEATDPTRPPT